MQKEKYFDPSYEIDLFAKDEVIQTSVTEGVTGNVDEGGNQDVDPFL